jgi:hypothetical protein
MAKFVNIADSIEGNSILVYTRKQIMSSFVELNNMGKMFKYKCSINTSSEITEELVPKEYKINSKSHLDLNDSLHADIIEVYCLSLLKFTKESNYTSTHSIQKCSSGNLSYAIITQPFRYILEKK